MEYPFEAGEEEEKEALPMGMAAFSTHTVEYNDDLVINGYSRCALYQAYLIFDLHNSSSFLDKQLQNQNLFNYLSLIYNYNVTINNLYRIFPLPSR